MNKIGHDRVEVANVSQVLPCYTDVLLVVLAQGHLQNVSANSKTHRRVATYGVVLDVGILDQLGADLRPLEVVLASQVAEVVRALVHAVELVENLCIVV